MTFLAPDDHQRELARLARQRFLQTLCTAIPQLDKLVLRQFANVPEEMLMMMGTSSFDPNAWHGLYVQKRREWAQGLLNHWREAFAINAVREQIANPVKRSSEEFSLIADEVIENLIASSRLSMKIADKVNTDFLLTRKLLRVLERQPLVDGDPIHPGRLTDDLLNGWVRAGMHKDAFVWVMNGMLDDWAALLLQAYQALNQFLQHEHGVSPDAPLYEPSASGVPLGANSAAVSASTRLPAGVVKNDAGLASPAVKAAYASSTQSSAGHKVAHPLSAGRSAEQLTQPMPISTSFGQKAISQVNSLWRDVRGRISQVLGVTEGLTGMSHRPPEPLSSNLQTALHQQGQEPDWGRDVGAQQLALLAKQQSQAIKDKAGKPSEKAIIEMVALMFQSVLTEDRVPPAVRVLFARLQVPVLRVALSEPEFFRDMQHPARRLIDRMGSSVMGFDGAAFQGSALENELRRIVQMIEQYPDTGSKVFQLAINEFEKFLQKYLSEQRISSKTVSVAQQIEEKETLLVKFTIELRKMLEDMPINDAVRDFLFKIWAEVLAVSAVRSGVQSDETMRFKRMASALVWVTCAKSTMRDRSRAAQALPVLLQRLRKGLTLVGVERTRQEAYVHQMLRLAQAAFLLKEKPLSGSDLKQMANRLENLEKFITQDGVESIDFNLENIEKALGFDVSGLVLLSPEADVDVGQDVMQWAQSRDVGDWFMLTLKSSTVNSPATEEMQAETLQVQHVWQSQHRHLHMLATNDGTTYLLKMKTLAIFFQSGQLSAVDQEGLMLRASRVALTQYQAISDMDAGTQVHPLPDGVRP